MAEVKVVVKNSVEGQQSIQRNAEQFTKLKSAAANLTGALGIVSVGAVAAWKALGAGAELELARNRFDNLTASIGTTADAMMG